MDGEHTMIIIKNSPEIKNVFVIILTSLGYRGDVARLRKIGCDGYLVKPIKQSLLLDAIITVFNIRSPKNDQTEKHIVTSHMISEQKFQQIHVLLAEDNPINQKLVATLLKKSGYNVDTAENGIIALEMFGKKNYDIVLMDVQMPLKDGFETTKEIRKIEGKEKHTTIIAMTAHALKGYDKICLQGGMDDYISKPIDSKAMLKTIEKWIKIKEPSE
ncbi:MAG: multi-sensor hybrid histidine kinase, partial [uncultured bacterium]